jgi:hypothetical protein
MTKIIRVPVGDETSPPASLNDRLLLECQLRETAGLRLVSAFEIREDIVLIFQDPPIIGINLQGARTEPVTPPTSPPASGVDSGGAQ